MARDSHASVGRWPAVATAVAACALALPMDVAVARVLHNAQATSFPVVEVRLADFAAWPANAKGTIEVPDSPVGLPVSAAVDANSDADTYGTYKLNAQAAQEVSDVISSLVRLSCSLRRSPPFETHTALSATIAGMHM